jgi:hypothetical protein
MNQTRNAEVSAFRTTSWHVRTRWKNLHVSMETGGFSEALDPASIEARGAERSVMSSVFWKEPGDFLGN